VGLVLAAVTIALPIATARGDEKAVSQIETIAVEGDRSVFALMGAKEDPRVLVYIHGRCGDPLAGMHAFPDVARAHGTTISVLGDVACPGSSRRRWSGDLQSMQRRIDASIAAVAIARGAPLTSEKLTLMGYSEGALRAESLAKRFPERYPRVVMAASPRAPTPDGFKREQALVTMVGARDVQGEMRSGSAALEKAGLNVRFFLLPGARHGTYGDAGPEVVGEALAWAEAHAGTSP
jgi:pimeloyl-ACP methyl ester carboxylesterase